MGTYRDVQEGHRESSKPILDGAMNSRLRSALPQLAFSIHHAFLAAQPLPDFFHSLYVGF
jgi:hypothetical protein